LICSLVVLACAGVWRSCTISRRRLELGVLALLGLVVAGFWGCGGGVVRGSTARTYQLTLTGISAEEAGSGEDASVDTLSISGTVLSVDP
jgi:hypothetical protein